MFVTGGRLSVVSPGNAHLYGRCSVMVTDGQRSLPDSPDRGFDTDPGCCRRGQVAPPASGSTSRPPIPGLVDSWITALRARRGRGLSLHTELAYRHDLAVLARVAGDLSGRAPLTAEELRLPGPVRERLQLNRLSLDDFNEETIEQVIALLLADPARPLSSPSRARYLSAWRGFSRWAVRSGFLDRDPTLDFDLSASSPRDPVYFSEEDLRRMLAAAQHPATRSRASWPTRDVALIAVLAGSGIRASELTGLAVSGLIREGNPRLHVVGKGGKDRSVPVGDEVVERIDDYLAERLDRGLGGKLPADRLFVRTDGRPFDTASLDRRVEAWTVAAGVTLRPGEKAHAFRHTYAVGQILNGTDVATLRQLLGHEKLDTTARYLRMAASDLAGAGRAAPVLGLLRELGRGANG